MIHISLYTDILISRKVSFGADGSQGQPMGCSFLLKASVGPVLAAKPMPQ